MNTTSQLTLRRGLLRIGVLLLGCAGAAVLVRALGRAAMEDFNDTAIGWPRLFAGSIDANDLYAPLFLAAILAMELVQNGWQKSALRRVLYAGDASTHTDVVYCMLAVTRMMPLIAIAMTFGITVVIKELEVGHALLPLGNLPLWLALPGVFLTQSFAGYWLHRLFHTPLLWPLHAVHHATTDFNVVTALRHHPLDSLGAALVMPLIPALLGFSIELIVIALLLLAPYTIYLHSELPTSAFLERFIAFGPHGHGVHHGKDVRCYGTNFGDFVIWDRLFGTYKVDVPMPLTYGCEDPEGIYQSGRPFRDMIAVQIAFGRNLWNAARSLRAMTKATIKVQPA